MRMNKGAILASMVVIALASVLAGAGTMAFFSSTKKAGIYIKAGNMNLKLSKTGADDSWGDNLHFSFPTGFAPGDDYTVLVWLKNIGTSGSRTVWVYGELVKDDDGLSDVIHITRVRYRDTSGWVEWGMPRGAWDGRYIFGDGQYPITLREFCGSNPNAWNYMRFFWGKWEAGIDYLKAGGANTQRVELTFHFDEEAGNDYQNAYCSFNIVFHATDDRGYAIIWEP